MSTKTAKVLHVIAFILILLTMAFVLVGWLFFKEQLMMLVQAPEEFFSVEFTPWVLIIEVAFVLLLALIWLLVLVNNPGRGATIAMTVIMAILLIGYFAVGKPFLNIWAQQMAAQNGATALAALSQFNYAAGTIANFAFVPGVILMILSLGSACGKNFKTAEEEETVQEPARQPYSQRPAAQTYAQRPQYSGQQGYGQQGYSQKPVSQNTGYIPPVSMPSQNTGYIPPVTAPSQNTGYIPPVTAPSQNTGYIPTVDIPETDTVSEMEEEIPAMETLPPVATAASNERDAAPVIYPWMKAAGAPKEQEETEKSEE